MKAKKGRRNRDKDTGMSGTQGTGMFPFKFLTVTSFPATHVGRRFNSRFLA